MATQGKAARSASGAAMSKYDVEVEARLKALEAKSSGGVSASKLKSLEERIAALESADKAQQEVDARFLALEDKVQKLWN